MSGFHCVHSHGHVLEVSEVAEAGDEEHRARGFWRPIGDRSWGIARPWEREAPMAFREMLGSQVRGGPSGFSVCIMRMSTAATTTDLSILDGWVFKLCGGGGGGKQGERETAEVIFHWTPVTSLRFSVLSFWIRA